MTQDQAPIIIDLGKKRGKAIKALKQGRGNLMDEVGQTVAQVLEGLGPEAQLKQPLPIVIIYRKKQKRRNRGLGGLF